jgi:hypothetical protein
MNQFGRDCASAFSANWAIPKGCVRLVSTRRAGEIRSPKPEIRRHSETRNPNFGARRSTPAWPGRRAFGLRTSSLLRISTFGFRAFLQCQRPFASGLDAALGNTQAGRNDAVELRPRRRNQGELTRRKCMHTPPAGSRRKYAGRA